MILETACRRTVSTGFPSSLCVTSSQRKPSSTYSLLHSLGKSWLSTECPAEVLQEHDIFIAGTMHSRRFFIAGEDCDAYMGIAFQHIREGDIIYVLLGGSAPYVLRPD